MLASEYNMSFVESCHVSFVTAIPYLKCCFAITALFEQYYLPFILKKVFGYIIINPYALTLTKTTLYLNLFPEL